MRSYLITDPSFYEDINTFKIYLEQLFSKTTPDFACFRDKKSTDPTPYAKLFLTYARAAKIPYILINSYLPIAKKLRFDGVHLTSRQYALISEAKASGLFTVVSTHTLAEAETARRLGADAVTISPIFASPGKGTPKGVGYLKDFVQHLDGLTVFALGGIVSEREIATLKGSGVDGFASIRYFI